MAARFVIPPGAILPDPLPEHAAGIQAASKPPRAIVIIVPPSTSGSRGVASGNYRGDSPTRHSKGFRALQATSVFRSPASARYSSQCSRSQGVPVQAALVGEYVRLSGDTSILNEKLGGLGGDRTVWQALLAYQRNQLRVRDTNQDPLIDWLHTYETGWDDKDSPFIDLKGDTTSAVNEEVFNLWSLQEMMYLARIQGEDPSPWEHEFTRPPRSCARQAMGYRYSALLGSGCKDGEIRTQGEKPDAYYFLYSRPTQLVLGR
jgi:hypothetical protein